MSTLAHPFVHITLDLVCLCMRVRASRFEQVVHALDAMGVPHVVDHNLVRGLDYYTGAVWEFVTSRLGAQSAVLAGGRYDGLARWVGLALTRHTIYARLCGNHA